MIVFNLICIDCNNQFEGWFDSSREYTRQNKQKLINCTSCNSASIKKYLMAPNLHSKSNTKKNDKNKRAVANSIKKYKKIVEKNFDYVGEQFTDEAKKIKYGEKANRPIYGEASIEQTKELLDEEISVIPLPWNSNKKVN